jgi:hypothetical protein
MKSNFKKLIKEYYRILEQDIQPSSDPQQAEAPTPDAPAEQPQPTQPPKQQASVGYAVLAQLVRAAFEHTSQIPETYIRYSDNTIRTKENANAAIKIIESILKTDKNSIFQQNLGKVNHQETARTMDVNDLINLAQLALQCIFYTQKQTLQSGVKQTTTDYNEIKDLPPITVDNAQDIINQIRTKLI